MNNNKIPNSVRLIYIEWIWIWIEIEFMLKSIQHSISAFKHWNALEPFENKSMDCENMHSKEWISVQAIVMVMPIRQAPNHSPFTYTLIHFNFKNLITFSSYDLFKFQEFTQNRFSDIFERMKICFVAGIHSHKMRL